MKRVIEKSEFDAETKAHMEAELEKVLSNIAKIRSTTRGRMRRLHFGAYRRD
jgi:hypothetical protein